MLPAFAAQAFDTGDPCAGGSQCCLNNKDGQVGETLFHPLPFHPSMSVSDTVLPFTAVSAARDY